MGWLQGILGLGKRPVQPDLPRGFGYKTTWLALRSDDPMAVAKALRLTKLTPAPRAVGEATVYGHRGGMGRFPVFLCPALDGWTLVHTGLSLMPGEANTEGAVGALIRRLSRTFGAAQYFGSYRVAGMAAWYAAQEGVLTRAYAFADGQYFANLGPVSAAERAVGLGDIGGLSPDELMQPGVHADEVEPEQPYITRYPTEDDPADIAAQWSIDPRTLDQRADLGPSSGWTGLMAQPEAGEA